MATKRRYQGSIPFQEPDCKYLLLNLLAVIHRDNGHYTAEHGVEKAVEHAKKVLMKGVSHANGRGKPGAGLLVRPAHYLG